MYEEGPARPTGGCAAVAMLIGKYVCMCVPFYACGMFVWIDERTSSPNKSILLEFVCSVYPIALATYIQTPIKSNKHAYIHPCTDRDSPHLLESARADHTHTYMHIHT